MDKTGILQKNMQGPLGAGTVTGFYQGQKVKQRVPVFFGVLDGIGIQ